MAKGNKKEMQEKYMEYQLMEQQMKLAHKQIEQIEQQKMELENVISSLNDIAKTKEGTEILVPIASGVFLKAVVKDNKDLIVNVGGGTAVKKTIPEVKKMLEHQGNELNDFEQELAKQLQKIALKSAAIEKELVTLKEGEK